MSLTAPFCTCDQREHTCSPPCKAHPERGGGLGNPGTETFEDALRRAAIRREREVRDAWLIEREKLARANREDIPTD